MASSLGGLIFGRGKDVDATRSADKLSKLSRQLFSESDPLRRQLLSRSENFLGGGLDVTQTPQYAALKGASDAQFGNARNNIIANSPAGGNILDALANMESQKAGYLSSGVGSIAENEMARAFALGTGQAPVALSGLGTAAGIQGQIGAAQSQQQSSALAGLGQGYGSYLGRNAGAKSGTNTSTKAGSQGGSAAAGGVGDAAGVLG